MTGEYYDKYVAVLSALGKGEKHKMDVEKSKQQAKSKAKK